MKKTRFTETQIVKAIQEHEGARDAKDICRELSITTAAFFIIMHADKLHSFTFTVLLVLF